jgi:hypothetical protein
MKTTRLVVVDWTQSAARIGCFNRTVRGWESPSELILPSRIVISHEQTDELGVLRGEEAKNLKANSNVLVFEHPIKDLADMEDAELAILLFEGLWSVASEALAANGQLSPGEIIPTYLVTPLRFSRTLLENLRAISTQPLMLISSIHEAAAFVIGSLRAGVFQLPESSSQSMQTICLVAACDAQSIAIACFDYARMTRTQHRIVIRDCFHTTSEGLSTRLHDCDWLGEFSLLAIVEHPDLPTAVRTQLDSTLQALADTAVVQLQRSDVALRLKMIGGAHIAFCAARQPPDDHVYDVAHAYHIGLQKDQQHFEPIVNKYASAHLAELPYLAAQAFQLRGEPRSSLQLNVYGGYSTSVADAVPLGRTTLWQEDLTQLTNATSLTAAVRIDQPGGGEFLLGVMPQNRLLRRHPFTLPGLMG